MIKVIEIEGEKAYLKKDWLGWRIVEPINDPETGKFIWKNFLSKKGFVTLGILLFFLLLFYLTFKEQLANYKYVLENPCKLCIDCINNTRNINFNGLKIR